MKTLAIAGKGGGEKSTTTINLAVGASRRTCSLEPGNPAGAQARRDRAQHQRAEPAARSHNRHLHQRDHTLLGDGYLGGLVSAFQDRPARDGVLFYIPRGEVRGIPLTIISKPSFIFTV